MYRVKTTFVHTILVRYEFVKIVMTMLQTEQVQRYTGAARWLLYSILII